MVFFYVVVAAETPYRDAQVYQPYDCNLRLTAVGIVRDEPVIELVYGFAGSRTGK